MPTTGSSPAGGLIKVSQFDWMSFVVFATILWFSFLVQAWQYSRRILVYESTSVRFNTIYQTFLWGALVALCGEYLRTWYFQRHDLQRTTEEVNHHRSEIECHQGQTAEDGISLSSSNAHLASTHASGVLMPDSIGDATSNSRCGVSSTLTASSFVHRSTLAGVVSVRIVPGRPDFRDIIDPISKSDSPAVLLCGPEKLRHNVRRTIQGDSKCAKICSIYEEVSEM
jgi:hypothetical protein